MLDAVVMAFFSVACVISLAVVYLYADDCEPMPAVAAAFMAVVFGSAALAKLLYIGGMLA